MKSKWFKFEGKWFESKKRATTIKEAWDKTLEKWQLKMDGWNSKGAVKTCGLCNLYWGGFFCVDCPIRNMTGESQCENTPLDTIREVELEYLFLLFVKEATYKGRDK